VVPDPREIDAPARDELRSRLWRYGWPFVPLAVLGWVTSIGDRYLIGGMLRVSDVGVYAAAYGLASKPLLMMSGTFSNWLRPVLFWHQSHGNSARARTIFLNWCAAVAACGSVAVVLAWLCGPAAARILLAEEYRKDAASIFVWVVAGYSIYAVVQAIENRLLSFSNSASLIWPSVVAAVSNAVLNVILIPRQGIIGAAEATAGAFLLQLIVMALTLATADSRTAKKPSPT
jgi:O-antigen/teichoic acid export membrane protein